MRDSLDQPAQRVVDGQPVDRLLSFARFLVIVSLISTPLFLLFVWLAAGSNFDWSAAQNVLLVPAIVVLLAAAVSGFAFIDGDSVDVPQTLKRRSRPVEPVAASMIAAKPVEGKPNESERAGEPGEARSGNKTLFGDAQFPKEARRVIPPVPGEDGPGSPAEDEGGEPTGMAARRPSEGDVAPQPEGSGEHARTGEEMLVQRLKLSGMLLLIGLILGLVSVAYAATSLREGPTAVSSDGATSYGHNLGTTLPAVSPTPEASSPTVVKVTVEQSTVGAASSIGSSPLALVFGLAIVVVGVLLYFKTGPQPGARRGFLDWVAIVAIPLAGLAVSFLGVWLPNVKEPPPDCVKYAEFMRNLAKESPAVQGQVLSAVKLDTFNDCRRDATSSGTSLPASVGTTFGTTPTAVRPEGHEGNCDTLRAGRTPGNA